jgi:glycosyltransferase involved in cell wall biosynthesis
VHDLGLVRDVRLRRRARPGPAADVLARCDVFLLPSLRGGVESAVAEAAALGLAIVATDASGLGGVSAGGRVMAVPARCPEAIAAAIGGLSRRPRRRTRAAGAGPAREA